MEQSAQRRIDELERLVSELRHDLRGAISPAALIADRLRSNDNPSIQRAGKTIEAVVERVLVVLEGTCALVPPRNPGT